MKYGFGVDVGGTTVKLGLLSEAGELLEKWELPTRTENGGENILPDIARSVQDCMARRGLSRDDCLGLGIGVPGPVDASGMVNRCVNLNWGVFNLHDALGILTGLRVRAGRLQGVDVETLAYPGFPTDLQAPMMALLCRAEGSSILTEHIFENRFLQVPQLRKMGASIAVRGRSAVVRGVESLHGARVSATDLRAGAALVLAGLTAEGHTTVTEISHIERGYVDLAGALRALGAPIVRVE